MTGVKRLGWGAALSGILCALALLAPSSGFAKSGSSFEPGTYKGITSQGLPITLTVSRTAVLSVEFEWRARCADGQRHRNGISAGGGQISRGSFSMGGTLNTGGTFQVDGVVNGTTASGTLSRSGPSAFGTFDCTASGVTWQAQASYARR